MFNQYGIGMKSALASCDEENKHWELYSHTAAEPNAYIHVKSPYREKEMTYEVCSGEETPWPGKAGAGKGTYISVPVSRVLFESISLRAKSDVERLQLLEEELAVTYGPLLKGACSMTFCWSLLTGEADISPISAMEPIWLSEPRSDSEICDFGFGDLRATYQIGRIKAHPDTQKYFKCNIVSSGLMVYLNGRLIQANLFPEIWWKPHPSYNSFLFVLNLEALDGKCEALPIPTPDKDHLVLSDPRFREMLLWVRNLCPDPKKEKVEHKTEEKDWCMKLEEKLLAAGATCTRLEMPMLLDGSRKVARSDLYARMQGGIARMYETKAGTSQWLDLLQLVGYALMSEEDGLNLHELVLVAKKHPAGVRGMVELIQKRWFRDLSVPKLRLLTWAEVEQGILN